MKVLKPFMRDGVKYRRDDPPPEGIDNITLRHYQRHGMVSGVDDVAAKQEAMRPARKPRTQRIPPSNLAASATAGAPSDLQIDSLPSSEAMAQDTISKGSEGPASGVQTPRPDVARLLGPNETPIMAPAQQRLLGPTENSDLTEQTP